MPHQCTSCGRTFADGSKEMLSGCPDCGGNKFQFRPATDDGSAEATPGAGTDAAGGGPASGVGGTAPKKTPESAPSAGSPRETGGGAEAGAGSAGASADRDASASETGGDSRSAVDRAAATVREWVGTRSDDERTARTGNGDTRARASASAEDSAQASARSDVVTDDELPDEPPESVGPAPDDPSTEDNVVDAPNDENPGLKELREELNSQFESIRIVNPGQYELNLMELYEREEYIIALQQDGKYVIEVPDAWDAAER